MKVATGDLVSVRWEDGTIAQQCIVLRVYRKTDRPTPNPTVSTVVDILTNEDDGHFTVRHSSIVENFGSVWGKLK